MSTRCISHAQIQTVSHSPSSNSSIALLHHSNKFTIIDRSILKQHTYSRTSELHQEQLRQARPPKTHTQNNSKQGKSACQPLPVLSYEFGSLFSAIDHILISLIFKSYTHTNRREDKGGKPHLTKNNSKQGKSACQPSTNFIMWISIPLLVV